MTIPTQPDLCSVQNPLLIPTIVTLIVVRPSVSSSLQITNRSFWYASPYPWNQFPLNYW